MIGQQVAIKFRIKSLIEEKEMLENRRITYRDIAAEADISTNTLTQMSKQKMKQIGLITLDKLCKYFDCSPGDILVYFPDDKP